MNKGKRQASKNEQIHPCHVTIESEEGGDLINQWLESECRTESGRISQKA